MSEDNDNPKNNGAVLNIANIIKHFMSSAAKAEICALFITSRQAIPARRLLEEMSHKQPPTPIQTDNTTALGFVARNLNPKATKSTSMRYWRIQDRSDQKQFRYYWSSGKGNRGEYWTKYFCAAHHREQRPAILTPSYLVDKLQNSRRLKPRIFRASSRVS